MFVAGGVSGVAVGDMRVWGGAGDGGVSDDDDDTS